MRRRRARPRRLRASVLLIGNERASEPAHPCISACPPRRTRAALVKVRSQNLKPCQTERPSRHTLQQIAGGGPNEVFVGYESQHDWNSPDDGTWNDPFRHDGKVDRLRLAVGGTVLVDRFDFVATNTVNFWHDRSALRMVFDHFIHPHNLYVGTEHGIDRVLPDNYSMPKQDKNGRYASWFLTATFPWLGDHLHPRACFHEWCTDNEGYDSQRMGDWYALAVDPVSGDLWVGGRWSAGKIFWVPDNVSKDASGNWITGGPAAQGWSQRGGPSFVDPATGRTYTYGDRWCGSTGKVMSHDSGKWVEVSCSPGFGNPPVFPVPEEGEVASISAVAQFPNGDVWWASAGTNGGDISYGLARSVAPWQHFQYVSPASFGMNDNVRDMVALPDGRLALGGDTTGLWLWTPGNSSATHLGAGSGLPGNRVLRLELDTMVNPPALHVATDRGAAVLRALPQ